ncbi:MAG: tRNA dihydrouridine synthase DusB [Candidatus Aadella gelida]|nr:tRNA dihydrouridine synthase DusB [Candidatus Aadella gelida]
MNKFTSSPPERNDCMLACDDPIETLKKKRIILAPMSGITDIPFRLMTKKFGCEFAFTEMIDINGLLHNNRRTFSMMDTVPGDNLSGIQLVGEDAEKFLHVGKMCEDKGFKLIDINAGCPARKVVKCGKGSALMKDVKKLAKIVSMLVENLNVHITVKIRSGWDEKSINCVEVAKVLEDVGASAIGIHPRTQNQMYKGKADHELTKKIKRSVKIPVIASGNIFSAEDVEDVFGLTGCDAIFVARGALGRPWIFDEISRYFEGQENIYPPPFKKIKEIIFEHYLLYADLYGDNVAKRRMYKHLMWYFGKNKNKNEVMKEYQKIEGSGKFKKFLKKIFVEERRLVIQ